MRNNFKIVILFLLFFGQFFGQKVNLFRQFNGRYDFTFLGNTMNPEENSFMPTPVINTTSTANLTLNSTDVIKAAYLYWAGSGTGDLDVKLNNITIAPDRTFSHVRNTGGITLSYFSAFKDVTAQILATGNGNYTLSDLDVNAFISEHYQRKTNFAGWAIIVVYKNQILPLNQLNIYDGLQAIPDQVNITLNSLNVLDNNDAKIGFLAWEGDVGISVNETLRINGNILSNPPLNPANNAFNGTNTITGSDLLYNMDLDIYNIQNNIQVGDTSAQIEMTSGQDFVMINAIVTKLNSQLPDATITIESIEQQCDSRTIKINYKVSNVNATADLPAGTTIGIYANSTLIGQTTTNAIIPMESFEMGQITITLNASIPDNFSLNLAIDDTNTIIEILETNNGFSQPFSLWKSPEINLLNDLETCNQGNGNGTFNFQNYQDLVRNNLTDSVSFYESQSDAENEINPITNLTNYEIFTPQKTIFVRIQNLHCFKIISFNLIIKSCVPEIYNFVSNISPFTITNIKNVYPKFILEIYNRWGAKIWEGNNDSKDWQRECNVGLKIPANRVPDGTYFYFLNLNDVRFPEPFVGYLYYTQN